MSEGPVRDRAADLATLRAVQTAAQRGELEQAAELAQGALTQGLEHPLLYNVSALKLEERGQLAEAEQLLRRAVALDPTDVGSRNALGLCLMRLERPGKALQQFDALLELNSALPFVHAGRGNAHLALGAIADAEASFRRALALDPKQGVALAGLAHIMSSRGAYAQARAYAEHSLAIIPGYPQALMSLAAAELGERQVARAESRIRALLADPRLAALERAHATGQLGDILDAQNRPRDAYAAYAECNEALRRLYAERYATQETALDYVRAMTRFFQGAALEPWKSPAVPDDRRTGAVGHVFLLGFPRSGTTLLEVILEGHPEVVSLEENESLIKTVQQFMQRPADLERLTSATPAELKLLRDDYWNLVAAAGIDVAGKIFVDKNPLNSLKLPLIARLFPNARILFACRDPRDIVFSCFRHRFWMSAPIYELLSLEGAARYYDAVMQLVLRFTSTLPLDVCLVRHEDLVTDFMREMKRICAYLKIDWDPAMGDFALRTRNRAVLTPSTAQLVRGLNTEGLGQWRRYREWLEPVLPLLETWVKRFYYDP